MSDAREFRRLIYMIENANIKTLADLPHSQIPDAFAKVMRIARSNGFQGFGGHCGTAAVAINRVLFAGKGTIVGGFNVYFQENLGIPVGHIVVDFVKSYWDADGVPKCDDDVESWGMLDPEDLDYREQAGDEWNEGTANDAAMFDMSEQEALDAFEDHGLQEKIDILKNALQEFIVSG